MPPVITIAFLSPYLEGSYFGPLLTGVEQVVQQHGARLIAIQTSGPQGETHPEMMPVAWNQIDGWVGTGEGLTEEYLQAIKKTGKPGALISATIPGLRCPTVVADNKGGMAAAVQHLIDHGHKRIAFVGCLDQPDMQQRYAGYQATLEANGIPHDPQLFFATPDHIEGGGREAAQRMLKNGLPCTAVVAATDLNAAGLMEVVQAAGYRVPGDLAVSGFDNMPMAQFTTPPLTSVHQSFAAIAGRATEVVLEQLAGNPAKFDTFYVDTTLVQRHSCGCHGEAPSLADASPLDAQADWKERLAYQLVQTAVFPQRVDRTPTRIWPGVTTVVNGLDAALTGTTMPDVTQLQEAWHEAFKLTRSNIETHRSMFDLLQRCGDTQEKDQAAAARIMTFLDHTRIYQAKAEHQSAINQVLQLETVFQNNYEVSAALAGAQFDSAKNLSWLDHTPIQLGCLALWTTKETSEVPEMEVVATYGGEQTSLPAVGRRYSSANFPPPEFWPTSASGKHATLMVLYLKTQGNTWGVLALFGATEVKLTSGRGRMSQWTVLLSNALEREALLQSLAAQRESLSLAVERERLLSATVRELGCPILPLSAGVLLIPLIGAIDSGRAQQFIEAMLQGITLHRATSVLLDITGVPIVDTQVANTFIQATQAATLLGAKVVLVGVRPEIAHSIIALGIDLRHVTTAPSLAIALASSGNGKKSFA